MGELEKLTLTGFFHSLFSWGWTQTCQRIIAVDCGRIVVSSPLLRRQRKEELRNSIRPCDAMEYSSQITAKSFRPYSSVRLFPGEDSKVVCNDSETFNEVSWSISQKDD